MLFDTHVHLNDERFAPDFDDVLLRAKEAGVGLMMTIGASLEDSKQALAIAQRHEHIYAAVGIHPHEASSLNEPVLAELKQMATDPKVKAFGEIGLDYHYDFSPRDVQRDAFSRQLDLAEELNLPTVLHIREAHGDALHILKARNRLYRGIVHCYSGSLESANEYIRLGFHISFTGSVTFKNATKLAAVCKELPLERIMVETDAPYMAPVPLRGKRNEPAYVLHVAQFIAELKGIPFDELAQRTTQNARALLGI